ncbi:hypothetical protein L6452_19531 [Arctium lappa]|uniref:Uncharacterized protein n=1 Tax=Arctium lappa TaxID=4217 RepID=A0ACB9B8B3_ARCLA|nr:hypothetical protein L6452_19531 [Arctium lappa]
MRDDEIVGLLPLSIVIASPQARPYDDIPSINLWHRLYRIRCLPPLMAWIVCAAIPGNCSYVHPLLLFENNLILQCSSVSGSLDACSLGQLLLYFFTELSEVGCRERGEEFVQMVAELVHLKEDIRRHDNENDLERVPKLPDQHLKKLVEDVYYFGFILLEALLGPIVSEKVRHFC